MALKGNNVISKARRGLTVLLTFAVSLSLLAGLSTCGGGGADSNPDFGGPVQIFPNEGTFYAGVPAIITVSGSHSPYSLTSSEPGILPVPSITNNNKITVVPNNPGVVDIGLQPGQLPIRTVLVSVRGPNATSATATIHVAQNFLTGYTAFISSPGCPLPSGATSVEACSGQAGTIVMNATFNGSLHGGERFRFCAQVGEFQFFDIATNSFQNCIEVISDHEGKIIAPFRVLPGAAGQIAIFRIIHVATGVYTDTVFVINPPSALPQSTLTAVPSQITFTGLTGTTCGTGSSDVFIFGGRPPFTAASTDPIHITVTPSSSSQNPPRFTITVSNPSPPCLQAVPVTFTDATGAHVEVTVTTQLGTSPTPTALTVAPQTINLNTCGASGSVSVAGGSGGSFSVNSSTTGIRAVVSGNTITITRNANGDPAGGIAPTQSVSVTDGASVATVAVNLTPGAGGSTFCP